MDYYIYNGELYHHGVKGMRWGQHIFAKRRERKLAKQRNEQLKKAREAKAKHQKLLKSGKISSKNMTDKELQDRINRLELERKYNELLKNSKDAERQFNKGKAFVDKMIDSSLSKIAENAVGDVVGQTVKVITAKGANAIYKDEVVFTNNKKK